MATKKKAAAKKAVATKKSGPSGKKPPEPKVIAKLALPEGIKIGHTLSAVYSAEESKTRGYVCPFDDGEFVNGAHYGFLRAINGNVIDVEWVFADSAPTKCQIDLVEGKDVEEEAAIIVIGPSPIPNTRLAKWKAEGDKLSEPVGEEEEEEEDDDVPFEDGGEDVDYE